jgi:hypothetical protein
VIILFGSSNEGLVWQSTYDRVYGAELVTAFVQLLQEGEDEGEARKIAHYNADAMAKDVADAEASEYRASRTVSDDECVFCGECYENMGYNPAPVISDENAACCGWCNSTIVLPTRVAREL